LFCKNFLCLLIILNLFFKEQIEYIQEAKEVLAEEQVPEVMASFAGQLDRLESFSPDDIIAAIKAVHKETGHKG
ncbi:hypothetical protein QCD73_19060, partial [Bacillus sp. PsM16]|nr:hypothetical protein [Bacillus sp. PsM16]